MTKQWIPAPDADNQQVTHLQHAIGVSMPLATILVQRGITDYETARKFFRPDLNELHDPFRMKDMDKAVHRLNQAIERGEKIMVYGDYDVDGTTAVTLVYSFLANRGVNCCYYIPDRYKEGYGFSYLGVDEAHNLGATLIITLDCGIRDGEKIQYASEKGIDIIVCDHHHVAQLPQAIAVLDPHRPDCAYPFKGLSGCGVGFKLLEAYCRKYKQDLNPLYAYLDLLAISIGADIVPVIDENRILAYYGLQLINQESKRPGIQAMLNSSGFKNKELTISDVVFILAPRINAAGRIVSGKQAVELLLAPDSTTAHELSPQLEEINTSRKEFDKTITSEAKAMILQDHFYSQSFTTVVAGKNWHKGVVGIVASRLIEEFYKPTIVLVDDGEKMTGSARSIAGIDLFDVLSECDDLLIQYGGHTMAAGLTLKSENFSAFRQRFDDIVRRELQNQIPIPFVHYDIEITLHDIIQPKFYRVLQQFGPFGPQNMRPVFLARNLVNSNYTRTVGTDNAHLKLHVHHAVDESISMDGIGFNMGQWAEYLQQKGSIDLLFSLEENTYNGNTKLQLFVRDIRPSSPSQPFFTTEGASN